MRFFFLSPFSIIFLAVIYFIGTWILVAIGSRLRKKWKYAWIAIAPLFLALYIGPIIEELWIAWNFEQLCKKDAGIFVHRTVEVEGFYDDTRPTHDGPRNPQAIEEYERSGFRFTEKRLRDTDKVVHIEKRAGIWTANILDRPSARYHYRGNAFGIDVAHGIQKFQSEVIDTNTNEVLGRYVNYYRDVPWFFIGLDRPTLPCEETERDARKYRTISVHRLVLLPMK